jgi:hypothetical protein
MIRNYVFPRTMTDRTWRAVAWASGTNQRSWANQIPLPLDEPAEHSPRNPQSDPGGPGRGCRLFRRLCETLQRGPEPLPIGGREFRQPGIDQDLLDRAGEAERDALGPAAAVDACRAGMPSPRTQQQTRMNTGKEKRPRLRGLSHRGRRGTLDRAAHDLSCAGRGDGQDRYSSGTSSNATMLMILISGLIAGPAVSL